MPALPGGHYERHTVDETKLNEFLGKAVGDLGAAISATLILVGDRLGLYCELAKGAMTSAELPLSRLPVGSSPRMTTGLFTSARAMAARCC